jgi:hypothetical protein
VKNIYGWRLHYVSLSGTNWGILERAGMDFGKALWMSDWRRLISKRVSLTL